MQWTEPAGKLFLESRADAVPPRPLIGHTVGGSNENLEAERRA